jgi:hypothetical protein
VTKLPDQIVMTPGTLSKRKSLRDYLVSGQLTIHGAIGVRLHLPRVL